MSETGNNAKKTDAKTEAVDASVKADSKVVKVAPYPIDCTMTKPEATPPIVNQGKILRLEEFGLMLRTFGTYFKLGDVYQIQFEVPVMKIPIKEMARIVKTTESVEGAGPDGNKLLTLELHFRDIKFESRKAIANFIFKIGQKKPT
jgi:hypothetical protein